MKAGDLPEATISLIFVAEMSIWVNSSLHIKPFG